ACALIYHDPPGHALARRAPGERGPVLAVLLTKDLWLVALATLVFAATQTVWMAFLALYLQGVVGLGLLAASRYLALAQAGGGRAPGPGARSRAPAPRIAFRGASCGVVPGLSPSRARRRVARPAAPPSAPDTGSRSPPRGGGAGCAFAARAGRDTDRRTTRPG